MVWALVQVRSNRISVLRQRQAPAAGRYQHLKVQLSLRILGERLRTSCLLAQHCWACCGVC